jgi:hypothetical protein
MSREQNDLGGGHSPRELEIRTGNFVPDTATPAPDASARAPDAPDYAAAEPKRDSPLQADAEEPRPSFGFLAFATLLVVLGWRFISEARMAR